MKFGRVTVQGENQVIIVMDDVTSRCRKDYQISLISQISESIQRDDEIDRVLYSILTAVTSGAGLGFNRAMLFLYDEHRNALVGKMAVGPDSFEEALQIWGTLQGENAAMLTRIDEYRQKDRDLRGLPLLPERRLTPAADSLFPCRFPAAHRTEFCCGSAAHVPIYVS